MLIMDEMMDWVARTHRIARDQNLKVPDAIRSLTLFHEAKRFVIDDAAVAVIKTLMSSRSSLKRASEHLFFPTSNSWFEWHDPDHGGRIAAHFLGWSSPSPFPEQEEIHAGVLTVHTHLHGKFRAMAGLGEVALATNTAVPFWIRPISDVGSKIDHLRLVNSNRQTRMNLARIVETEQPDPMMDEIGSMALGFLALLNSPKLVSQHFDDRAKLNKRRVARGKFPLMTHMAVRIDLAKDEFDAVVGPSDGASRPLHFVRAYLRVHYGRLQLIWPYWRGDPSLGICTPRYEITHKEKHA